MGYMTMFEWYLVTASVVAGTMTLKANRKTVNFQCPSAIPLRFRLNPKSEYRNPKQYRMIKCRKT